MRLYHYTCAHAKPRITNRGMLRPNPHPLLGRPVLWLTDQAVPDRHGLGLTSNILECDRLAYRYIVDTDEAKPWREFADVALRGRMILESVFGAKPDTWWVCETSVLGVLDREYSQPIAASEAK